MKPGGCYSYNIFTKDELKRLLEFVESRIVLDKLDKRDDKINQSIKEKIEKELK